MRPIPSDSFPSTFRLIAPERIAGPQLLETVKYNTRSRVEFFHSPKSESWLWNSFARPVRDSKPGQAFCRGGNATPARIETLPNELLDIIIDELSDHMPDLIALGLSSAYLWSLLLRYVHNNYQRNAASWAGTPVAFVGVKTSPATYPSSFRKLHEHGVVRLLRRGGISLEGRNFGMQPTRLLDIEWTAAVHQARSASWPGFDDKDWKNIAMDLKAKYMFPSDRVWLLRNMDKKMFVRSDRLIPDMQCRGGIPGKGVTRHLRSGLEPLSFGQILLVYTCHSNSIRPQTERMLYSEGQWSGDCFDITTLDQHNAEDSQIDWIDVSEGVVNDLGNLRHWTEKIEGKHGRFAANVTSNEQQQMIAERLAWASQVPKL